MKNGLLIFAAFICFGCHKANSGGVAIHKTISKPSAQLTLSPLNKKILGLWTDGDALNAIFDIGKDSIYYVDQSKSFKYSLVRDSIKIYYDDGPYLGRAYFVKDTLIMESKDFDTAKFWRFK